NGDNGNTKKIECEDGSRQQTEPQLSERPSLEEQYQSFQFKFSFKEDIDHVKYAFSGEPGDSFPVSARDVS
ncbi:hypothetical protein scyTo_0026099, partial [Scyliorhinus torazame]|nr:hypothetical protein [Scyliorhinus torazame]